jgi:exodeoxyribonuclease V alpha subunit
MAQVKSLKVLLAELAEKKRLMLAASAVPLAAEAIVTATAPEVIELELKESLHETYQNEEVVTDIMAEMRVQNKTELSAAIEQVIVKAHAITLDIHQEEFIRLALEHDVPDAPIILIGAAGTGKTTTVGKLLERIFETQAMVPVSWAHNHLPTKSAGIIVCSFTRRATNNIRKRLPLDLQPNCITIHKFLEFEPDYFEVQDPKTREWKTTMRFIPRRDVHNKIAFGLSYLIVEEYSMLGADLWAKVKAALPEGVRVIFVGDIYQLPPVMDTPAVAPYLCIVPTIELKTVYRTALDNPIIKYATDIRNGKGFKVPEMLRLDATLSTGSLTFKPWKQKAPEEIVIAQLGKFFRQEYISGNYDPADAQILIPWKVRLGSYELNRWIATAIAVKHEREVHEVICGYVKKYYSVGDRCIWDKNDCEIIAIERNPAYSGVLPQDANKLLDYWGHVQDVAGEVKVEAHSSIEEVEMMLNAAIASAVEDGQRVKQCSHKITVRLDESGTEHVLKGTGDISVLDLSYAMTIHSAQGSEWRKVYLCFHAIHASTLNRELLYTGFTRAKEELFVICEQDTFIKGVAIQAIKGATLEQKAETLRMKAKLAAKGLKG